MKAVITVLYIIMSSCQCCLIYVYLAYLPSLPQIRFIYNNGLSSVWYQIEFKVPQHQAMQSPPRFNQLLNLLRETAQNIIGRKSPGNWGQN